MNRLRELFGRQHELDSLNRSLRHFVQSLRAAAVGAVHVTCSDECERESVESFHHWFAEQLLPELKSFSRAVFRTANLGGRYEWGAVRIAEAHFATPASRDSFKLLVVKINSHVAVTGSGNNWQYGFMNRYEIDSPACGALDALLSGQQLPAVKELRETFQSEGNLCLESLLDPQQTDPNLRPLLAAIVNARLQARRAIVDIQDYGPVTPTYYLVLPCVTLNLSQRNSELVVGAYSADFCKPTRQVTYQGLGDNPARYEVSHKNGLLRVEDDQLHLPRTARDHREEILVQWQRRRQAAEKVPDQRFREVINQAIDSKHSGKEFAKEMLKTLLWLSLDLSPIPAAILLFGKGMVGAHHLYRVHRLARGEGDQHDAKPVVEELLAKVQQLPDEQARKAVDTLVAHYQCEFQPWAPSDRT